MKKKAFALLVLSFLVLRLGVLLTGADYVSWDEEVCRGTLAKDLLGDGLKVPFWEYRVDHYDGGSLWVEVLAVPFFLLLGPNLFALKLVPLLFSLATLVLTFFFLKKFFSRKVALLACSLFVLCPPVFTSLSLSAIGSHPESILFSVAMFFFLYQFLYEEKRKAFSLALLGLTAGGGLCFASITLITLFTCLASWFFLNRRSFLTRQVLIFLGAFLVGILPWILYESTHEFRELRFLGNAFLWQESFFEEKLKPLPASAFVLFFKTFPFIFSFRPFFNIPADFLSLSYGLVVLFLVVPFFWKETVTHEFNRTKTLPFLLYPFFFILVYLLSNLPPFLPASFRPFFVSYRYFSPLYYFLFSLLALAFYSQKKSPLFVTILLGLGLMGQGSLLFQEPLGRALHYQGYSYMCLGEIWGKYLYPFPRKFGQFQLLANQFAESERRLIYWGLSGVIFPGIGEDPRKAVASIQQVPSSYRSYFIESWGRSMANHTKKDLDWINVADKFIPEKEQSYFYYGFASKEADLSFSEVENYLRSIRKAGLPDARPFYFELGRLVSGYFKQKAWNKLTVELLDSLGEEEKTWAYRGLGAAVASRWPWDPFHKAFDSLRTKSPSEVWDNFSWGIGWGLGSEGWADRRRGLDRFRSFSHEIRPLAWEGFRAFEKWYGISPEE